MTKRQLMRYIDDELWKIISTQTPESKTNILWRLRGFLEGMKLEMKGKRA